MRLMILSLGLFALTGCVATWLRKQLVPGATVKMTDNGALILDGRCVYQARNGEYVAFACWPTTVVTASEPDAVRVWEFEARVKVGDGMGRRPTDVLVAGRERCDKLRAGIAAGGTPTEACKQTDLYVLVPAIITETEQAIAADK